MLMFQTQFSFDSAETAVTALFFLTFRLRWLEVYIIIIIIINWHIDLLNANDIAASNII